VANPSRPRDYYRHHRERAHARAVRYVDTHLSFTHDPDGSWRERCVRWYATDRKPCSCPLCTNGKHSFPDPRDQRQAERHDAKLEEL